MLARLFGISAIALFALAAALLIVSVIAADSVFDAVPVLFLIVVAFWLALFASVGWILIGRKPQTVN